MSPRAQVAIGVVLVLIAGLVVWLWDSKSAWAGLVAIFLGAVGGQMFGQAYKRSIR